MSKLALYRKYRPQTFADITGQHHIKITLENEIASDRVAHAYLFTGPRGVGKTTTARILSKAVNCLARGDRESEPCNNCDACRDITAGNAFDVIEIDAASNTGVDNVRENIIENVRFGPSRFKAKIFIIDEVHMLSASAFNALLKTLEEPPEHTIFILATTELHKVPATIVSRCQRFDFRRIGLADLKTRLAHLAVGEGREVEAGVIAAIARAGGGSLRDAESTLDQVLAVSDGRIGEDEASLILPRSDSAMAIEFLETALRKEPGRALVAVSKIIDEGVDPLRFLDDCVAILRKALSVALERSSDSLSGEFEAEIQKKISALADEYGASRLVAAIELLLAKRLQIKDLDNGLLPLELAAAELAASPESNAAPIAKLPIANPSPLPTVIKNTEEKKSQPAVPEPKTQTQAAKPLASRVKTTIETVKNEWQKLIQAVGEINHSLPFILNVSMPIRFDAATLIIGSRYPFHCERLNALKHHQIISDACEKVFG